MHLQAILGVAGEISVFLGPSLCLLVAAACSSLANSGRERQPWRALSLAFVLMAFGHLLWSMAGALPYMRLISDLSGLLLLSSLVLMLEFGRQDLRDSHGPFFNSSLYLPAAVLSGAGLLIDFDSLLPMLLFAWGAPAFLASSRSIWRGREGLPQRSSEDFARGLLCACNLFGGASFCALAAFWMLSTLSGGSLPIAICKAVSCLWPLALLPPLLRLLALHIFDAERRCKLDGGRVLAVSAFFAALVVVSSFLALLATNRFLDYEMGSFRKDRLSIARLVDESVYGSTSLSNSVSMLLASEPGLASYMASPEPPGSAPKWVNDALERHVGVLPPGSICYLMDKRGLCVASSKFDGGADITGRNFAFRAYFKKAMDSGSGIELAFGVATMQPGFYSARALRSASGEALGVSVVKTGVRRCVDQAGDNIAMLVDPAGFCVLSNDFSFEQRALGKDLDGWRPSRSGSSGNWAGRWNGSMIQVSVESSSLPGWRIALLSHPDRAMGSYKLAGLVMAIVVSGALALAFSMRHAEFWRSVAVHGALSWRNAILDSQAAGVVILDASFRFLETNKAFFEIFGYYPESLKGKPPGMMFRSFRSFEAFSEEAAKALDSTGSFSSVLELQSKDGATKWCEVTGRRLESPGAHGSSVWIFIDRTLSKESTDKLKDSEERYKTIFENAPIGIVVYDSKGACVMANRSYAEISGGSMALILQQDFRRIKSWGSSGLLAAAEASLRDGASRELVYNSTTSFGKKVVARCVVSCFPMEGSRLLVLMVEDHSAKSQAERNLKDLLNKHETLYRLMPAAAFTVAPDGIVTSFNAKAELITGYSASEIVGKSCRLFTLQPCHEACGLFSPEIPKPISRECTIRTKDGRIRSIAKNADLVYDAEGKLMGGIETFEDVTDIKESEARLKAACRAAEEAAEAKTEFLANVSHEIRTPMNGILGLSILLMQTRLGDEQREYVAGVIKSSERLLSIIKDVLDISRIEAGRLSLSPVPTNVKGLLLDTVRLLQPKAQEKGLDLRCEFLDPAFQHALADPSRLRQILVSLIGNAIKFTAKGFVSVKLSCRPPDDGDASVRVFKFEVKDSGSGIPESLKSSLFERLFKGAPGASVSCGPGLGLTVSAQLVKLMGGSIWADSVEGEGSSFSFEVPLKVSEAAPEDHGLEPSSSRLKLEGKVLVVEDNLINRMVISGYLKRLGCHVEEAFSGEMALDLFAKESFDLVLMDIQMEGVSGYEAALRMRESRDPSKAAVPIVAITASSFGDEASRCLESGINSCLPKPIGFESLCKELQKWLSLVPSQAQGEGFAGPSGSGAPVMNSESCPVVDERQLLSVMGGDLGGLDEIAELSSKEFLSIFSRLEQALTAGNMQGAKIAAHSLKGASANLGGARLSALCKELELAIVSSQSPIQDARLGAVKHAMDGFFAAIRGLGKPPGGEA